MRGRHCGVIYELVNGVPCSVRFIVLQPGWWMSSSSRISARLSWYHDRFNSTLLDRCCVRVMRNYLCLRGFSVISNRHVVILRCMRVTIVWE